ncbi:9413_t:CDS:2 [Dentiscutata heterogama]|uniref:9413_t:CDS:1 n=1 Tax=Dentiscutata heterogama TaxID=1316150 RepID=A0ACA9MAB6_9GLOM|nr:9413_t:CDS:2 [Dentiscutata heterogama]
MAPNTRSLQKNVHTTQELPKKATPVRKATSAKNATPIRKATSVKKATAKVATAKIIDNREDNLREEDLNENEDELVEDYLGEDDLEDNNSAEVSNRIWLARTETSHSVTKSKGKGIATAPSHIDENSATNSNSKIINSAAKSHKNNENDFEWTQEPQEDLTELYNSSNELEAAMWVVQHPSVLNLANIIHNGRKTKIQDSDKISEISTNSCNSMDVVEITKHMKWQLQNECKALFLRTRNNTKDLYEELAVKVCKIRKSDYRMVTLVKDMGSWFDVYRHNLHVAITSLAGDFAATHQHEVTWKKVLRVHLQATDLPVLNNDSEIITKLGTFIRQAVRDVLIAQNKQQDTRIAIRKCDEITLDLKIPTKLGIVKTLPVRTLLTFFHK